LEENFYFEEVLVDILPILPTKKLYYPYNARYITPFCHHEVIGTHSLFPNRKQIPNLLTQTGCGGADLMEIDRCELSQVRGGIGRWSEWSGAPFLYGDNGALDSPRAKLPSSMVIMGNSIRPEQSREQVGEAEGRRL
jgi:hypothetical protein